MKQQPAKGGENDQLEVFEARKSLMEILKRRLDDHLERIFKLLGLKYPPEEIDTIYQNIKSDKPDLRLNAVEFLDNLLEVNLKRMMAQKAPELIILADHTKLGNVSLSSFAPLSRVRALVTDEQADPKMVQIFRAEGIEVVIAPLNSGNAVNSARGG